MQVRGGRGADDPGIVAQGVVAGVVDDEVFQAGDAQDADRRHAQSQEELVDAIVEREVDGDHQRELRHGHDGREGGDERHVDGIGGAHPFGQGSGTGPATVKRRAPQHH